MMGVKKIDTDSVVSSGGTRGNGHKVRYKPFHLNIRKPVLWGFYCKAIWDWSRSPREVMSLYSWRHWNSPEYGPDQAVLVESALKTAFGLDHLQRTLLTLTIVWFCVCWLSHASKSDDAGHSLSISPLHSIQKEVEKRFLAEYSESCVSEHCLDVYSSMLFCTSQILCPICQ